MSNNEWITHRKPTEEDANNAYVYDRRGKMVLLGYIGIGEPWKPIPKCEPYVKPKRFQVVPYQGSWCVRDSNSIGYFVAFRISTIEAAERIAAIYEEMMP